MSELTKGTSSSSAAVLRPASADEQRDRDRLSFQAWGTGLTPEQWAEREVRLRSHPWPNAALRSWVWAKGEHVLASLEAYRMPSLWRGERGEAWAIATVFTEPALRGRGHASAMMRALGEEARAAHPRPGALILFSDVGEPLYGRAGYRLRPSEAWMSPAGSVAPHGVEPISEAELPGAHAALAEAEGFRVHPSLEQLDWHLERARYYAEVLGTPRPSACGARIGASVILWTSLPHKGRLDVLWLQAENAAARDALWDAARNAAHLSELAEVHLWTTGALRPPSRSGEPAVVWPDPPPTAVERPRPDGWPMILPLSQGLEATDWRFIPRAIWV